VGNSAAVPALRALGHEVWPLPTIILSNHPAHGATAATAIKPDDLDAMLSRLAEFGWLDELDAVFAGYFRDPGQVAVTARHIESLKRKKPALKTFIDPIIGDDPRGLYVPLPVAEAIRDRLLPLADIIAPNRFELSWLAGMEVENLAQARTAVARLPTPEIIVTSFTQREGVLSNLLITADRVLAAHTRRRPQVPQGTGDLLSSLTLGHWLNGYNISESLGRAVAGIEVVLDATGTRDELALTAALPQLATISPATVESA